VTLNQGRGWPPYRRGPMRPLPRAANTTLPPSGVQTDSRSAAAKRVHQMHAQAAQMNASARQTVVQKILSSYGELLARRGCVPKKAQRSPPQPRDSSTLSSLANASSPRRRPRRVGLCWQRVRLLDLDLDLAQVTAGKCRRSSACLRAGSLRGHPSSDSC
jgi:hypothetical protein